MGKVVCFYTREEIKEMPATKEEGEALIENLLRFELFSLEPVNRDLMDNLIYMIEVNSGANKFEVIDKIYAQRKI